MLLTMGEEDLRLFTVLHFSVRFDGPPSPPSWSLDASETGETTKCPWVVAVGFIAYGQTKAALAVNSTENRNISLASAGKKKTLFL